MTEKISLSIDDDWLDEIDEDVENGNWKSRAAFVRAALGQFQNKLAVMDPRQPSEVNDSEIHEQSSNGPLAELISDEQLLTVLTTVVDESDSEYVDVDTIVDRVVGDVDQEIGERLVSLSQDPDQSVETDGFGNYSIKVGDQ